MSSYSFVRPHLAPSVCRMIMVAGCLLIAFACSPIRDNEYLPAEAGETCQSDEVCGAGLVCARSGLCAAVGAEGTVGRGEDCVDDSSCRSNFICDGRNVCSVPRERGLDQRCYSNRDCTDPLVCARNNRCLTLDGEGTVQLDAQCDQSNECALGLTCGVDFTCVVAPTWTHPVCALPNPDGIPQIFFRIPGVNGPQDFHALPYPNDIRRYSQTTDLSDFPGAESYPVPGALLSQYVAANQEASNGFGLNETIYFRFDGTVDYDTLKFGGGDAQFSFVDISPDSARYGLPPRSRFYATGGGDEFMCANWLGIRPAEGTPLAANSTYAVFFKRGLLDSNGVPFEPSEDFSAMLDPRAPLHPALLHAWTRYEAFRTYLSEKSMAVEDIIGATVFTTGDPRARVAGARTTVYEAATPQIDQITECNTGAVSPCAGGEERACGPPSQIYREIHARIEVPGVLRGSAPYDESGGQATFRGSRPRVQSQEKVCVSVSLPRQPRPPGGWPVIVFAHDLGGHFRTAMISGLAQQLTAEGWAVIGYDGVLHGARFGTTNVPSIEQLAERLYDLNRPGFLRDQSIQGMVDLHALVRFIVEGDLAITGTRVKFDHSKLTLIGHGLGGEYAVPFLAYEPLVQAAILSNVGGSMVDTLRLMREPRPLGAELALGLGSSNVTAMHPALQLIQTWLDPRDPQNFGGLLRTPPENVNRKHLFYLQGVGTQSIPIKTVESLLVSMNLKLVGSVFAEMRPVKSVPADELPLRANVANSVTQGAKQYEAENGNARNILFEHPKAKADMESFLQGLRSEGIPTIPE